MMRKILLCMIIVLSTFFVRGQEPKIGYLYPAGGQQGTVVRVIAGGQFLKRTSKVYISGKGVTAKVIGNYKLRNNINREQRILLQQSLKKVRDKRIAELPENVRNRIKSQRRNKDFQRNKNMEIEYPKGLSNTNEVKKRLAEETLPKHPLLNNLENKSLRELAHIEGVFFNRIWRKQRNRQLAELVEIEVVISPDAALGNRELRLETQDGMTGPVIFQINNLPEITELEPNNINANEKPKQLNQLPEKFVDQTVNLPVMLNGQIMPGDVDRFRFYAEKGQKLIIEANARRLIPYLADAVPGWFQATLTLYNSKGKKMAFTDDYKFNPDPVLYYTIPETGKYEIEIRDAIYRGREDFVYRISISEKPFVTKMFPLGGREGVKTIAKISGYNLSETPLILDTVSDDKIVRKTFYRTTKQQSNPIIYAVNNLPECDEKEPDNLTNQVQHIALPKIINGRINQSGDVDIFSFQGKVGEKIVAEVFARRLNSPLDSMLRLTDANGKMIKFNDDYIVKDKFLHKSKTGLLTHHSDSYLMTELPKSGTYHIKISDTENRGGEAFAYRLRISNPQPDFTLFVTPSTLNIKSGTTVPFTVHAIRKEGFTGPIKVTADNTGNNFKIAGGFIPAGCDKLCMTLSARPGKNNQIVALKLNGSANINGKKVVHNAIPTDDTMQAFLYCHLVAAKELILFKKNSKWKIPVLKLTNETPIKITRGKIANIHFKSNTKRKNVPKIKFELDSPTDGVEIKKTNMNVDGIDIKLLIEKNKLNVGYKNNLIIAAYHDFVPKQKKGKKISKKKSLRVETLPAVSIEIVE